MMSFGRLRIKKAFSRALCLFATFSIIICSPLSAQEKAPTQAKREIRKVVIEVTSGEQAIWEGVIGNIENLKETFGRENLHVEVIGHGEGIRMLKLNNLDSKLKELSSEKVIFSACENTMRKKDIKKNELQEGVRTVDSGLAQVIRKQDLGWAYIKADT